MHSPTEGDVAMMKLTLSKKMFGRVLLVKQHLHEGQNPRFSSGSQG